MLDPTGSKGHLFMLGVAFDFLKSKWVKEKPVEKFNKHFLKISYHYKDKPYFYLLKVPKGVAPLQSIVDENQKHIEDIITPYLGPNLDCHGITLTPKDFGYKSITITTVFDKVVVFDENDPIVL